MAEAAAILSPNWDKLAKRYQQVAHSRPIRTAGLIQWAMDEAQRTAVEELDRLIYLAPPPPSAAGHEMAYLARNRTNRTRLAVRKMPEKLTVSNQEEGGIFVDPSFYDFGRYYARPLNDKSPSRGGRPFWNNARALMRAKFAAQARTETVRSVKAQLKVI